MSACLERNDMKKMKLFVSMLVCASLVVAFDAPNVEMEKETSYWMSSMKDDLLNVLRSPVNTAVAKNIIIFVGDGMGVTVTTAGRIYKGQLKGSSGEEEALAWDEFPNSAMMKTYNLDRQTPDSGATATAYFCGVKANFHTTGVNGHVVEDDCLASLKEENFVDSILKWSQDAKKETGFVTTARVTHATPAGLYAHTSNRKWECDTDIPEDIRDLGCTDTGRQLVQDFPGKDIKVILGGGRSAMGSPQLEDPGCRRVDGLNLIEEWKSDKTAMNFTSAYASNTEELLDINVKKTDFIMGLFSGDHMPYEMDRDTTPAGAPSVKEMTTVAIERLQRSETGYFLMVEAGRIDHGLHTNMIRAALTDVVALDEAVAAAKEMVDLDETLIIVTSDHSHVLTLNGYAPRGTNVLGLVENEDTVDDLPYPVLMFTNGPGGQDQFTAVGDEIVRHNYTGEDTTAKDFMSPAFVPMDLGKETHGGEDVGAYAIGPMAHLFRGVHEQSYVSHVMAYAACVGPYANDCERS